MNIRLTKSTIEKITLLAKQYPNWKKLAPRLREIDVNLSSREVYDLVHPHAGVAACGTEKKFVSYGVGYRFCGPANICACARKIVSDKVRSAKMAMTSTEVEAANTRRAVTTKERYGVDNVFQLPDVIAQHVISSRTNEVNQKRIDTNLRRYGVDNPAKSQSVKEKTLATNVDRYGGANPMSSPTIKEKVMATNLERYGGNPMNDPVVREKFKQTNIERYGVANAAMDQMIKNKIANSTRENYEETYREKVEQITFLEPYRNNQSRILMRCDTCLGTFKGRFLNGKIPKCPFCNTQKSYLEREMAQWLNILDVEFVQNSRSVIAPFEVDFFIPSSNLAIEMHGLYYHSDDFHEPKYHLNKLLAAENNNIKLIQIFEDEWINKSDIVKNRLIHILKKNNTAIMARKCQLMDVSQKIADEFYNVVHIQGSVKAPLHIALYHHGDLVSMMSFSRFRFGDGIGWELLRFASHGSVVGGASRLLKQFIRSHNPDRITSFADRRWSNGDLYSQLGFIQAKDTPPGYFYFRDKKKRYNRIQFQKHKLVEEGYSVDQSEGEIMRSLGYRRIYDCGNKKFVMDFT